ncbi:LysR family transcriptional regulator [Ectobacillus polymachus]|uniref:LysR family transcriptional regulator n=1 Tax=Ectobacillus polymachus TaxID=1508806 RepID=UPI003A84E36E
MNIDWYYTFIVLAKHLNYRKASEELFITQPSVFNQIKKLEEHMQVKLFETIDRHIKLTEEGEAFLPIAKELINTYETGMEKMRYLKNHYSFRLNIVVTPYIATYLIPKFLPIFFKNSPNIDISISVAQGNITESVENDDFQIGLNRVEPFSSKLNSEKICEGTIKLVVPNMGPNQKIEDELSFLKKYRLIINNHPTYWEPLLKEIQHYFPQVETTSIQDVKVTEQLIKNEQGISYLPVYILKNISTPEKLKIVEPNFIQPPVSFTYIMWRKQTPEIEQFINLFKEFIKKEQV